MSGIVIREAKATPADAQILYEMFAEKAEHEGLPFNTAADAIAAMIERGHSVTLLAEQDSHVVGFANYNMADATFTAKSMITIQDLYTHPDHRGQGIGKALLNHIANIAIKGKYGIMLPPVADNTRSIDWYKKLGAKTFYQSEILRIDDVPDFMRNLEG